MKKHYLLLYFLLSIFIVSAQEMPIDFSDNADVFTGFGGSGFSTRANPDDASDTVAQFFNDGSDAWQGFFINLASPVDLDVQKVLTLNFYRFDPNAHSILIKLEQGGANPDIEVFANIPAGSGNSWTNDIQFDFDNAQISGTANNISGTGQYNRLTIYIDAGSTTPGTYLIDDINDGSTASDPHELDVVYTDLVWSDEFDSGNTPEVITSSKWHHQVLLPRDFSQFPNHDNFWLSGWFNNEEQHYTDRIENSYMQDGNLYIVAKKENFTDQGHTKQYTSARLNSTFAFTYGRVDVRAKLPTGSGTWPAIWTLGKNIDEFGNFWHDNFGTTSWPACGEIDIMEHGLHADNVVSAAIHTPSSSGATVNTQTFPLTDVANDFHVYSVNWSPNQLTFLIDGVGYYTYNPSNKNSSTWPFDLDQYLILNVAMGGFAGTIDPNFVESPMVIDYVRVYQNSTASIEDVFASKFSIYPNPVSEVVKIKTNETIDKIELYSLLGQLVGSKKNSKELTINQLKSGMYLLRIYSGNKTTTKKVLIR